MYKHAKAINFLILAGLFVSLFLFIEIDTGFIDTIKTFVIAVGIIGTVLLLTYFFVINTGEK